MVHVLDFDKIYSPDEARVEFRAVLLACRPNLSNHQLRALDALVRTSFDWGIFLAIAKHHRVVGILNVSVSGLQQDVVPQDIRDNLREGAQSLLRSNVLATVSAVSLTKRMEEAGIETTVLKGVTLGWMIFGKPGIRHSKDIDLLVDEKDAEAADALLQESGYVRKVPPRTWNAEADRRFRAYRSHSEYLAASGFPQVELHWRLQHNPYLGPGRHLWGRRRQVEFAPGMSVWTLEEVDLLCYLCTHGALHGWSRLKWIVDISMILLEKPDLGEGLVDRSKRDGTIRATGQGLLLCRDLFDVPLPENLGRPTPGMRLLAAFARRTLFVDHTTERPMGRLLAAAVLHFSHLLVGDRRGFLFAELRNKLLVPSAWGSGEQSRAARFIAPFRKIAQGMVGRI